LVKYAIYIKIYNSDTKIPIKMVILLEKGIAYAHAKILIVDDHLDNIELLERILRRSGYTQFRTTTNPQQAIPIFHEFQPDLILLDLHMPEMDGLELLHAFTRLIPRSSLLPILILTADISPQAKREALLSGAKDFLTKPFDTTEVLLRIRNLLQTRFLHLEVQLHNQLLEDKVKKRTSELEQAQIAIIECLAKASEFRDDATGEHTKRVGEISARLAGTLGFSKEQAEMIGLAATLHDIGKIGISDQILLKPDLLNRQEHETMKLHTTIGKEIISNTHFPVLFLAQSIALTHHERWDGTGYPNRLKGEEIPLAGQIVAIADVFDALTHQRPYKEAWTKEQAMVEISKQIGKQFSPKIVDAFITVMKDVTHVEVES
jgi:putative two-component system response regulator